MSKRQPTRAGVANRKLPKSFSSSATKQARLRGELEGGTLNLENEKRRAAANNPWEDFRSARLILEVKREK